MHKLRNREDLPLAESGVCVLGQNHHLGVRTRCPGKPRKNRRSGSVNGRFERCLLMADAMRVEPWSSSFTPYRGEAVFCFV